MFKPADACHDCLWRKADMFDAIDERPLSARSGHPLLAFVGVEHLNDHVRVFALKEYRVRFSTENAELP